MVDGLATTITVASLLVGLWCLIDTFRDRPMLVPHLVAMAALELLLLAQAVTAIVRMIGGDTPGEIAVFLSYLLAVVLIPPACAAWGFMERSRWGPAVIAFACLILPVMLVRLQQIWNPAIA